MALFFLLEANMKAIAALLVGGALICAIPADAQDKGNVSNQNEARDAANHERASHHPITRRVTYKRNYKTDLQEHQRTEELNQQYRGVPNSEAR
jgi:hypothetical protein